MRGSSAAFLVHGRDQPRFGTCNLLRDSWCTFIVPSVCTQPEAQQEQYSWQTAGGRTRLVPANPGGYGGLPPPHCGSYTTLQDALWRAPTQLHLALKVH